jgi:hypothetical protein
MGHLAVLVGMSKRERLVDVATKCIEVIGAPLSTLTTRQHHVTVAVRGAWAAARLGKDGIALYEPLLAPGNDLAQVIDATMALTAIGVRHANAAGDARRALATLSAKDEGSDEVRVLLRAAAELALREPEEAQRRIASVGAKVVADLNRDTRYRASRPEDVDPELARLAALHLDLNVGRILDEKFSYEVLLAAAFARAQPEELYMTAEMREAAAVEDAPWRIAGFLAPLYDAWASAPVKRERAKIGRNDPCPCGSGKKAKRCCGVY